MKRKREEKLSAPAPFNFQGTVKLTNCRLIRDHQLFKEDLWFETPDLKSSSSSKALSSPGDNGGAKIIDPEPRFWEAQSERSFAADQIFDCGGLIVAPGYIDIQLNGGFGVDFSTPPSSSSSPSSPPHSPSPASSLSSEKEVK